MSSKQLCSLRESTGRVNVWEGSIRSGKTIASLLRWLIYCATAPRGGELVVIARTREAAARNVFGPLMDLACSGPSPTRSCTRQVRPPRRSSAAASTSRRVRLEGREGHPRTHRRRRLRRRDHRHPHRGVLHPAARPHVVPGAQLFGTTNPDNPAHWLKRKFLDRLGTLADWRSWHFLMEDNPSLTAEYIASTKREFTGLWYRRFILGEWVAAEGAVFDMWDPTRHVIPFDDMPPIRRFLGVGIDAGTQHATTALALGLGYDRRLYLMDELGIDPSKSQVRLNPAASRPGRSSSGSADPHMPEHYGLTPEWIIADQAGAWLREQLHQAEDVTTHAADKDVSYGIGRSRPSSARATCSCPTAARASSPKRPATRGTRSRAPGEDKPIKVADDYLDAGRYVITTLEHAVARRDPHTRSDLLRRRHAAARIGHEGAVAARPAEHRPTHVRALGRLVQGRRRRPAGRVRRRLHRRRSRIAAFYGSDTGRFKAAMNRTLHRWFVGEPARGNERNQKLIIPTAAEIAQGSADLLFADPFTVTVPDDTTQKRVDGMLDEDFHTTIAEAAEMCAALGGVYLVVAWDPTLLDHPFPIVRNTDQAIPEFSFGRLTAVTFWSVIASRRQERVAAPRAARARQRRASGSSGTACTRARRTPSASPCR
jgi:hypothetical protein